MKAEDHDMQVDDGYQELYSQTKANKPLKPVEVRSTL